VFTETIGEKNTECKRSGVPDRYNQMMSHSVRVFQVDAFTSTRFCGNPAGVVLDADKLSADQMLALARELNNADTAFVLKPDADDHDLRVRFFTPRREAAFVGHATVAAHAVRASLNLEPLSRQKQSSGIVTVDTIAAARPHRIAFHQPPPAVRQPLNLAQLAAVLEALTLTASDLDPRCPATIVGQSSTRVLLGVEQGTTLARLQPNFARLTELSAQLEAPGFFLYSLRPTMADVYSEARMFCPAIGITEDPVSGNAHALLGAYLMQHGLIRPTEGAGTETIGFTGAQGHHVGRPGRVSIGLNMAQQKLESITVVGEAVIVFSTTLQF
jgi:PhzF family phenazine biosynthesis protein